MYFKNRLDAAQQLARQLEKYGDEKGVVLAVPRGGVPIGHYIAKHFNFPLELLLAKKLSHPSHPEYAIGAVTLEDASIDEDYGLHKVYLENEIHRIRVELTRRYEKYMGKKQPAELKDKTVIVVDDGIATGRTLKAALKLLRKKQPKRLVVAVPVAPPGSAAEFEKLADDFICLYTPQAFYGVGTFYDDFSAVADYEVIALLKDLNDSMVLA